MAEISTIAQKDRAEATSPEDTRGGVFFTPRVDIHEGDKELTLFADVPGVRPEDVDLRYEQGQLLLHARVRPRQHGKNFLLNEYEIGRAHV